jgi:hypothetical protein
MQTQWVRVQLRSCRFSLPSFEQSTISGGARLGYWRCVLPQGHKISVSVGDVPIPLEGRKAIPPERARVTLQLARLADQLEIFGDIHFLERLQGGGFERFRSRDEVRQAEWYRCIDAEGWRYDITVSYPIELERDDDVRVRTATFWRMMGWVDGTVIGTP